jgi:hypothetical protein
MRKMKVALPLVLVLGLVTVVGCAKPPEADISSAKSSIEAARAADAADYASDSLKAAEDAQGQLDTELKAQEQKFAMFRSYKKASELAADAKMKGDKAAEDAKAAKQKAKDDASALMTEAKTAVEEAKGMLDKAPKGKGTQADLEQMKTDLSTAEASLTEADTAFNAERYLEAKSKADAAKTTAMNVKSAVEQAMEAKKTMGHKK